MAGRKALKIQERGGQRGIPRHSARHRRTGCEVSWCMQRSLHFVRGGYTAATMAEAELAVAGSIGSKQLPKKPPSIDPLSPFRASPHRFAMSVRPCRAVLLA